MKSRSSESLARIPIPPRVRWREFRARWVPGLVFLIAAIATGILWRDYGTQGTLMGVGEGVQSVVASSQAGLLRELLVEPYQLVDRGQLLAVLVPTDSRAQMDLLQTEFELARLRLQPSIAENNVMNFERIRVELLKTKAELAIARVRLELAEKDVARNLPLVKERLVSEEVYELSAHTRDMHKAEVEVKAMTVTEIESRMALLGELGDPHQISTNPFTANLLGRLERAYASASTNVAPIQLLAPISGRIALIQRQPGEHVLAGEPIVAVHSLWSERIVGYLRQPYTVDPEAGMPVLVTTRTSHRQQFWSHIAQLGAQIQPITNSLAFLRPGVLIDAGLPIVVDLPPRARIRPGELVDLLIVPGPDTKTNDLNVVQPALGTARLQNQP